jgi:hypothetical protein
VTTQTGTDALAAALRQGIINQLGRCPVDVDELALHVQDAARSTDEGLRAALFDEYDINVVDEALQVAIHSPTELQVNRERWQTARSRLHAALASKDPTALVPPKPSA